MNFCIPEPVFMKVDMYIMTPEPISTAYFINPLRQCVYLYPPVIAKQRLLKKVTAMSTHARIELLDVSFSMRSVLY
jgi:hypothetical protein